MKKQNKKCLINMLPYGIKTSVLTTQQEMQSIEDDFNEDMLHLLPESKQKDLFEKLRKWLIDRDAYFNMHLDDATRDNDEWTLFCNGYVELAMMGKFLFQFPIVLIHPDNINKFIPSNPKEAGFVAKPDLIEGIFVIRRNH